MAIRSNGGRILRLGITGFALLLASGSWAQNPSASTSPADQPSTPPNEGKDIGGFHVTQSIELG